MLIHAIPALFKAANSSLYTTYSFRAFYPGPPRHFDTTIHQRPNVCGIQYQITHTVTLFKHTSFHFISHFLSHPTRSSKYYIFNYEAHHLVTFYFTLRYIVVHTRGISNSGVFMLFFSVCLLVVYLFIFIY